MRYLSLIITLVVGQVVLAQDKQIDSLRTVFEASNSDSVRLATSIKLSSALAITDSAQAEQYIAQGMILAEALNDEEAQLFLTLNRTSILFYRGNHTEALKEFMNILPKCRDFGFMEIEARTLKFISATHAILGDHKEALDFCNESLKTYSNLGNKRGIANVLIEIGGVYQRKGQYNKADSVLEHSLSIYEEIDDKKGLSNALSNLGINYRRKNKYNVAKSYYKRSLKISEEIGDQRGIAYTLNNLGTIYLYQRNYTEALSAYEKSLEILIEIGDRSGAAVLLMNMSGIQIYQSNYDKALEYLERSLVLNKEVGHKEGISDVLTNMGFVYLRLDSAAKSISYLKKSMEIKLQLEDSFGIARSKNIMIHAYLAQQNEDSAVYYFQHVYDFSEQKKFGVFLRMAVESLADYYSSSGQYVKALDLYYDVLERSEVIGDTLGTAIINEDIGDIHRTHKNLDQGIEYYEKAIANYEILKNVSRIAEAKSSISQILNEKKDYQQSLIYAKEALIDFQQLGDSCRLSKCFLTIGSNFSALSRFDSAKHFLSKALTNASRCAHMSIKGMTYLEQGKLYDKEGLSAKAFEAYKNALKFAEASEEREVITQAAAALYPIYEQRGQVKKALETFKVFHANNDSLFNEANIRSLAQKEIEYRYEKEKQENELKEQKRVAVQQQKLLRQQQLIHSLIICFVAIVFIAIFAYRSYKIKRDANKELTVQNEEIAKQKKELEELDNFKSRFFANISHELRTPLTLISSPIESLVSGEKEKLTPVVQQTLKLIERNTKKLKILVNDILSLSKIESNKMELKEEVVNIKPFIDRLMSNYDSIIQQLGIRYSKSSDFEISSWLLLDVNKVEKVLNNLLFNAVKYTSAGGQIEFICHKENDRLIIKVVDTGCGISKDDLPHVFDRYFQSKQTNAPLQGGTGIGLALSNELTSLMGGDLSVKSELGKGSTFTLSLPYRPAKAPDITDVKLDDEIEDTNLDLVDEPAEPIKSSDYTVMIVEDHDDMRNFINDLLKDDYRTIKVPNGKVALEAIKKNSVDLIIADVMMPEMDGYSMLQELKSSEDLLSIPVIMLTALDLEENRLQALSIGVDDYLTKPFSSAELIARVKNLVARSEIRSQLAREEEKKEIKEESRKDVETKKVLRSDLDWLNKVVDVIKEHLEDSSFYISDLADHFHLSERQFHRRVKKITGLNPKQYQQEIALQKAREIIEKGEFGNITAVAYSVGMNNVSRFSNLYLTRFGKKPLDYFEEVQESRNT